MPHKGKQFFIRSYMNGYVLDVEGDCTDPGTKVIMYPAKAPEEAFNQLWYQDMITNTIRSVATDYCLDIQDDRLCINPYRHGDESQQWMVAGQFISNMETPKKVLDVVGQDDDPGAEVCCYERHGNSNQLWYIEHVPARYFHIESRMHGKVMDISGDNPDPGAEVILYERKEDPSDNQLFYAGRDGLIRSKLNGFVLDSSENEIKMQPLEVRSKHQGFVFSDGYLVNVHNKRVVDISGRNEDDGANVIEWDNNRQDNQQWVLRYVWL